VSFKIGDHIVVFTSVFHHGIYVGKGSVIHFSGDTDDPGNASIRREPLSAFGDGRAPRVVSYSEVKCFSAKEVVKRAESRLGEKGYSLLENNCEHYAVWCKTGEHESFQVRVAELATGPVYYLASLVEASVYEGRCSCGSVVTGLSTIWLCRNCGRRFCTECIVRLKAKDSTTSAMLKTVGDLVGIGETLTELLGDRRCRCGNTIDSSQRIRQGLA
jgi:hypothetical protein